MMEEKNIELEKMKLKVDQIAQQQDEFMTDTSYMLKVLFELVVQYAQLQEQTYDVLSKDPDIAKELEQKYSEHLTRILSEMKGKHEKAEKLS